MLKLIWNGFLKAKMKKSENSNVTRGESLAYCLSLNGRQQQAQFKICGGNLWWLLVKTTYWCTSELFSFALLYSAPTFPFPISSTGAELQPRLLLREPQLLPGSAWN